MKQETALHFVPRHQTRRLDVCDIYCGDQKVGQERVTYPGGAISPPPTYQYLRWDLAVPWGDEPITRGSFPVEMPPECDEDGVGFICPGFGTITEFEQSLRDYPFNAPQEVEKCRTS